MMTDGVLAVAARGLRVCESCRRSEASWLVTVAELEHEIDGLELTDRPVFVCWDCLPRSINA